MTKPVLETLIDQAAQAVQRANWNQWKPANYNDYLLTSPTFGTEPRLSFNLLTTYLNFYAWVWKWQYSAQESEQVNNRLLEIWAEDSLPMSYERMNAVWSRAQLFNQILALPLPDQEQIRQELQNMLKVGVYPELEQPMPESSGIVEKQPAVEPLAYQHLYYREDIKVIKETQTRLGINAWGQIERIVEIVDKRVMAMYAFGLAADLRFQYIVQSSGLELELLSDGVYRISEEIIEFTTSKGQMLAGQLRANGQELTVAGKVYTRLENGG